MTLTGNTKRFINKLDVEDGKVLELHDGTVDTEIDEDYILVVPTYETEVTYIVNEFLDYSEDNVKHCKGIIGAGNINFDSLFCFTAKDLSLEYDVPVLRMIEFTGTKQDVEYTNKIIKGDGRYGRYSKE